MRSIRCHTALGLISVLLFVCFFIGTAWAELTTDMTVLLPEEAVTVTMQEGAACTPSQFENMLMISADGSSPIQYECAVRLRFDLKTIPVGATIDNATLRLVGSPFIENKQLVKIFTNGQGQGNSIGMWFTKSDQTIFDATSDDLVSEVGKAAETEDRSLSLWLFSKSRLSNWNYYSLEDFGKSSSQKPRLIVTFQIEQSPILPTDRTAWKYFLEDTTFKSKDFLPHEVVISNPVFYKSNIFLFAKPPDTGTTLYALNYNGRANWHKAISDPPGANALVNSAGILYSLGENQIALYDLNEKGELKKTIKKDDFKLSNPPVLGRDSSLYFTRYGYFYGLNPDMKKLWQYPDGDVRADAKVSRITLSPDAQKNVSILMRIEGENNKLVSINVATGESVLFPSFAKKYTHFHRPLIIERQGRNYIFMGANSEQGGVLHCYAGGKQIWATSGSVSQPVSGRTGNLIYAVQEGQLLALDALSGKKVHVSSRSDLAVTSNLVLDGDDNVYFWNNGRFFVFNSGCELLVEKQLPDLPEHLELLFSPDGTLYARSAKSNTLTLVLPTRETLTLSQDILQNDTIYSADALRVTKNIQLATTDKIALKARDSISIGTGFSVKKGARLSCKIGF